MPRSSSETPELQLSDYAIDRAEREIEAYFTRPHDGRRHEGWRATVEAVLATLPAYHRGVLSLHHDAERSWPAPLRTAFGGCASLAVRLDCCDHPAIGPTPVLEAAAAERLVAIVAAKGTAAARITNLCLRAWDLFDEAVRAYAKARRAHAPTRAARAELDQAAE
jgi:hypothetical protein